MKHTRSKQSGYTLIELLVAVTIFAIFLAVASTSLVNVLRLEQKANVLRKTQQDTRYILESIVREARSANGELNKNGIRISHAYQLESTGNPNSPFRAVIITTDQGGVAPKVVKKVYSLENGMVRMDTLFKFVGGTAGSGFSIDKPPVFFNDTNEVRILKLDFSIPNPVANIALPPLLRIKIESESGRGRDFEKPELRAHIFLTSSATPRSY